MKGKQLNLFIKAGHYHDGQPLEQWTMRQARRMGIMGGSLVRAAGGYGHDHEIDFGRLNDDGQSSFILSFVVSDEHAEELLARLKAERVDVFFSITDARFGLVSQA